MNIVMRDGNGKDITDAVSSAITIQNYRIYIAVTVHEKVEEGYIDVMVPVPNWDQHAYLIMPGAVYSGNRFSSVRREYSPRFFVSETSEHMEEVITDVPKLSVLKNESLIELSCADVTTPAIGCLANGKGTWLLTDARTEKGITGLCFHEHKAGADMIVRIPSVKTQAKYRGTMLFPSDEKGCAWQKGERIVFSVELHESLDETIPSFLNRFLALRTHYGERSACNLLPFSAAFCMQERKMNAVNWTEPSGYFAVGERKNTWQDFQSGWTGGVSTAYALFLSGDHETKQRAVKTFDFQASLQMASGFFASGYYRGIFLFDMNQTEPDSSVRHLVRRSGDVLYFFMKMVLSWPDYDKRWDACIKKTADAFVSLWKTYHQLGFLVNAFTGEIVAGGSTSGALIPAGLVLAGKYFENESYIQTAGEILDYFYKRFLLKGYTCGGPGDVLMCPDSESAFCLLESYVVMYETTMCDKWLDGAIDAANLCATWCVSYDFSFPVQSEFGRLGMKTYGSVWANVQNKHSSPGICTLSGNSLLKLFRATSDIRYWNLLHATAHHLTQYLSTKKRPIHAFDGSPMPEGWMNERVNLSDWEGKDRVGEIFYGTCWCETSLLLTICELPGVYICGDDLYVLDHVTVEKTDDGTVILYNPTDYDCTVTILKESKEEARRALKPDYMKQCIRVRIGKGEKVSLGR